MHRTIGLIASLLTLASAIPFSWSAHAAGRSPEALTDGPRHSRLVLPGPDGKLIYQSDEKGNPLPDFSHAGYGGGGTVLPAIPTRVTVGPSGGEDRQSIQDAIDRASSLDADNAGFRGGVLLRAGTYRITGTLYIRQSGVVLRGEKGTLINHHTADRAKGEKTSLVRLAPEGWSKRWSHKKFVADGSRHKITDRYVPLGARQLRLSSVNGYKVGDAVVVTRRSTRKWIAALGMDAIPERSDGKPVKQWQAGKFDIPYYRFVTAIEGKTITLDAPLFHSLSQKYGPGYVEKLDLTSVLHHVGVENIEAKSQGASFIDSEAQPWVMIHMEAVFGGWVRNVTSRKYAHALVQTGRFTRNISVTRSRYLEPESEIRGRRRYPFHLQGQLHLGWHLFAEKARHDFVTGRQWSSGIVFLDSRSVGTHTASEPHHRYSTGILYDNVRIERPNTDRLVLGLWNRGNYGSGHGWAAANSVLWNCVTESGVAVEKPPLAQNFAIVVRSPRMTGASGRDPTAARESFYPGKAHWEWWNHGPVTPRSLYRAQLRDRLGPKALDALGPPPQR